VPFSPIRLKNPDCPRRSDDGWLDTRIAKLGFIAMSGCGWMESMALHLSGVSHRAGARTPKAVTDEAPDLTDALQYALV